MSWYLTVRCLADYGGVVCFSQTVAVILPAQVAFQRNVRDLEVHVFAECGSSDPGHPEMMTFVRTCGDHGNRLVPGRNN